MKKKMVVAVIDSGVNKMDGMLQEQDIEDIYYEDQEFKTCYVGKLNPHGTEIIKVLLKEAPDIKILSVRTLQADNRCMLSAIIHALEFCIEQKVDVINLSLGSCGSTSSRLKELQQVCERAIQRGIVIFAADNNISGKKSYPANFENVIGVVAPENQKEFCKVSYKSRVIEFSDNYVYVPDKMRCIIRRGNSYLCPFLAGLFCRFVNGNDAEDMRSIDSFFDFLEKFSDTKNISKIFFDKNDEKERYSLQGKKVLFFADDMDYNNLQMYHMYQEICDIRQCFNRFIQTSFEEMEKLLTGIDVFFIGALSNQFINHNQQYLMRLLDILLCGFLILHNILAISIVSDRKLYGRIKTLGASPKQVKFSVFYQYFLDALVGIPLGLILGYFLGSKMVPVVITSLDNDIYVYTDVADFIGATIVAFLVVFISAIRPAYRACAVDPSDILSEENNLNFHGKTHRRSPGFSALFELSLSNLVRYSKRNVIAITLLTVGLVLTSCVYVINHSFDISKYMAEIALSDITITEKTLVESWGEYNPKGNTITKEFMEKLEASGDILEQGVLYSQDISLQTSETAYNNVIQYYEQNKCERLKYMEQDVACGIHNSGALDSQHDGIHRFFVGRNAKVKYVEKHYGTGEGYGKRILNPVTEVYQEEGSYVEMQMVQIKGVDSTIRTSKAVLSKGAKLVIKERLMTHGKQKATSIYEVELKGEFSNADVISRSVAKDYSNQSFEANIIGANICNGHAECDAIIMDQARVLSIPKLDARHMDAMLIHEAAIGKIAGEQLIKLMTLGLTEKEAEECIVNGFLK